ncbi:alpha/beta hydrolase-fold protein [Hanstruepera ponticola]|uniref:alpha/beta hydrolase-fold protein n=1 Tax=Hanstruepera ponticola TaxID=2042995 RepID=UPI00177D4B68|nr:alpha/beta hydrolase-fold protein [Hanstruepera ponticola]
MKRAVLITLFLTFFVSLFAQTTIKEFKSGKLNSTRQLKIKLPKDYDDTSTIKYPLIIVFDGDYLFGPVVGQTQFQTYFDEMPGCIVVGISQGKERPYDSLVDEVTGLPFESGARFFEFIGQELIPYLDAKYNTSKFRVAVGHNIMGNFINSFMMKDLPLFHAYVNLSPDLVGSMGENISNRLEWAKSDVFYYMATSSKDKKRLREEILETNERIKALDNPKLTYYFDDFEGESHYTLVTGAVSKAFDKIFEMYKPLHEKELTEKVLPFDGTLDEYLVSRYDRIEELFGIVKPISEEEFQKVVAVADEREDIESLQKLGKLANKQNPDLLLGNYYLALHAEKTEKPKKAVKFYEAALALNETEAIKKDLIQTNMDALLTQISKSKEKDKDKEIEESEVVAESD